LEVKTGLLSEKEVEVYDLMKDSENYGIRFYAMPGGYEFAPFIEALIDSGATKLSAIENDFITHLAQKYGVMSVPKAFQKNTSWNISLWL
jgi:alkyl hydroperoxide reductase subunit AhpF